MVIYRFMQQGQKRKLTEIFSRRYMNNNITYNYAGSPFNVILYILYIANISWLYSLGEISFIIWEEDRFGNPIPVPSLPVASIITSFISLFILSCSVQVQIKEMNCWKIIFHLLAASVILLPILIFR